jgi:anti-sigma factor RsiW
MSDPHALTCQELVEIVTAYLEGALSPADCARFESHLARCTACRRYLDQMRKTITLVGHLPQESISDEARDQLLDVFRDWKRR